MAPPGAVAETIRPQVRIARAGDDAEVDGELQGARLVIVTADIADRREPGPEDQRAGRGEDVVPEGLGSRRLAVEQRRRPETRAPVRARTARGSARR